MTPRFFIVRHGNTFETGERSRRIGSSTDIALTVEGKRQAALLGRHFTKAGGVERILCGSLRRTIETAERIADQIAVQVTRDIAWLDEIDHGPDEGCNEDEVIARIGRDALNGWDRDALLPKGWVADTERRIAAWRTFVASLDRTTLLVTSNGASRFLFIAIPTLRRPASLSLATGAFGEIETSTEGTIVRQWNIRPSEPGMPSVARSQYGTV